MCSLCPVELYNFLCSLLGRGMVWLTPLAHAASCRYSYSGGAIRKIEPWVTFQTLCHGFRDEYVNRGERGGVGGSVSTWQIFLHHRFSTTCVNLRPSLVRNLDHIFGEPMCQQTSRKYVCVKAAGTDQWIGHIDMMKHFFALCCWSCCWQDMLEIILPSGNRVSSS